MDWWRGRLWEKRRQSRRTPKWAGRRVRAGRSATDLWVGEALCVWWVRMTELGANLNPHPLLEAEAQRVRHPKSQRRIAIRVSGRRWLGRLLGRASCGGRV